MRVWLSAHWVPAALIMGLMLLLLLPVEAAGRCVGSTLLYLTLPGYMLHQVEEHWDDRFRSYANAHVFGGVEALSAEAVLWINILGVWGVNLLSCCAGSFWGAGWGLAAIYLMLVDGLSHIVNAIVAHSYNPGLVSSVIVFLPLTLAALVLIPATPLQHTIGLSFSLAIHAWIIVHVVRRARMLQRVGA